MARARPRKVLVLGGSGEIGSAVSKVFAARGDEVVSTGRQGIDLASQLSIDDFFRSHSPDFDVLVHCAGINNPKPFGEFSHQEILNSFEINVRGFLGVVNHLEPHLRAQGGRVLAISSIYGFLSRRGRLPYSMSKHALVGAVKTLAIELGPHGVLVNALSPGFIMTKLTTKNNNPEMLEKIRSWIPVGRLGTPDEIAEVAYFLCSPANTFINGADIVADGGFSVGGFQV
jgi:NAD(P)-dependent dehydrogenase (short-subunit alcohol dehydrogenase family)